MRTRTDEFDSILFDIPDRRVGRNGQFAQGQVAEQTPVRLLDHIARNDAGKPPPGSERQPQQPAPVQVDIVAGKQPQSEGRHLVRADPGRQRKTEQRRTRAQRVDGRAHTRFLQCSRGPDQRGHRAASPRRGQRNPLPFSDIRDVGRCGRERLGVLGTCGGQAQRGPGGIRQKSGVLAQSRREFACARQHVEVLAEPKDIQDRA